MGRGTIDADLMRGLSLGHHTHHQHSLIALLSVVAQVDYIINNGWTPCLEFADPANSFVDNGNCVRLHGTSAVSLNGRQPGRS